MKKCPECGNPSYDGAPVCGNCGYKFPKPKSATNKREDIFQREQKAKKPSNDESIVDILKEKKLLIGIILLITLIVICG
ncbi:MAG: zinc ribbon domain-containing protein, partial [Methanobrevibacter sp.]|nr:zinc ribbon domain-containing protein [Methanobrevibacter sp.]